MSLRGKPWEKGCAPSSRMSLLTCCISGGETEFSFLDLCDSLQKDSPHALNDGRIYKPLRTAMARDSKNIANGFIKTSRRKAWTKRGEIIFHQKRLTRLFRPLKDALS